MSMNVKSGLGDASVVNDFKQYVKASNSILALLGAGLSASSGLSTFRGAGGLWRKHSAMDLATPEAFDADPSLVWAFYSHRRQCALAAQPNSGHLALAGLARLKPEYTALSQNVDGLLERAGHPNSQLKLLHGNLFRIRCSNFDCTYVEVNYNANLIPALIASKEEDNDSIEYISHKTKDKLAQVSNQTIDLSDENIRLAKLGIDDLPSCPTCRTSLLRPGVVWFGEALPDDVMSSIEEYIEKRERIELILVIGTSASVYPAASYIDRAKEKGARVAVINTEADLPAGGLSSRDWFFRGDASKILPELLSDMIGNA